MGFTNAIVIGFLLNVIMCLATGALPSDNLEQGNERIARKTSGTLFESVFKVNDIYSGEKIYNQVHQLLCKSENHNVDLTVDVHSNFVSLRQGERFRALFTTTLDEDGADPDSFDYQMNGQVYHTEGSYSGGKFRVYMSFGGLIAILQGDAKDLHSFEKGQRVYLLMRKED